MKTFWNIIGIIIVLAAVAVGLYFLLRPAPTNAPGQNGTNTQTDAGSPGKKATKNYTDETHGITFDYVSDMTVAGVKSGDTWTQAWCNNTPMLGLLLAKGTIDRSVQPNTNFAGATFTVGTSNAADAVAACDNPQNGESSAGMVTINGVPFNKFTLSDAGAGNLYDTTSYRTIVNGRCVAVEYTIHSLNIGNFDPSQNISAFDRSSVMADLETSALSFTLLPAGDRDLSGKWTGVEGTSLTISRAAQGSAYDLKFVELDGPVTVKGTLIGPGALEFSRGGKTYTTFLGTGDDTGMKYLMGKKDCIVIAPYEGYCKS